jgi:aminoglycoside phosphotransferase (APT) family kinase protein
VSSAAVLKQAVDLDTLERIVRKHLKISLGQPVDIEEISRHSNLNYVYKARVGGSSIYLKMVPERPKRLPMSLPRERVFAEAEAMRCFARHSADEVLVPGVLFVDPDEFVLGMTDVGERRQVLLDVIHTSYPVFVAQAPALGTALAAVHSSTRGLRDFRPPQQDQLLRAVVFQGLLGQGARAAFPDLAERVLSDMSSRRECLVHADLWGKNILIGEGVAPAIVDFEGAFLGDPAFDVATVLAVSLLPALEHDCLFALCGEFAADFLFHYRKAYLPSASAGQIVARAFWYVGTLIAARGFGPFAYPMSAGVQSRLGRLARNLTEYPPVSIADYGKRMAA